MPLDGWDHVELWVGNAKQAAYYYERAFGFTRTAYAGPETGVRDRASYVLEQGEIRLVLTSGAAARLRDRRASSTCTATASRTSRSASPTRPRPTARPSSAARAASSSRTGRGRLRPGDLASIATYGDVVHTFVDRGEYEGAYLPGFVSVESANGAPGGVGLLAVDHIVGNVELGRMDHWVAFYERVFGMTEMLHFSDDDISDRVLGADVAR